MEHELEPVGCTPEDSLFASLEAIIRRVVTEELDRRAKQKSEKENKEPV